jgi:hypothetical protein
LGLPGFVKDHLLAELRERGVELQYERLRLHWYRGIVAENVVAGRAALTDGPQLSLKEVTVRVNGAALRRGRLRVDGLELREGRFILPLTVTNQPPYQLVIEQIQSDLLLLPGDRWELTDLRAQTLGCQFAASAVLTNASSLPRLTRSFSRPRGPDRPPSAWPATLRRVVREIEAMQFSAPPQLTFTAHADAADTNQFQLRLHLHAESARTRWGTVRQLNIDLPVAPSATTPGHVRSETSVHFLRYHSPQAQAGPTHLLLQLEQALSNRHPDRVEARLTVRDLKTKATEAAELSVTAASTPASGWKEWLTQLEFQITGLQHTNAGATKLTGQAGLRHTLANPELLSVNTALRVTGLKTPWGSTPDAAITASSASFTNRFLPLDLAGKLTLDRPQTRWGTAASAQVEGTFSRGVAGVSAVDPALGFWTNLWPYTLATSVQLTNVHSPQLELAHLNATADWRAPILTLSNVHAALYDGALQAGGRLDVATRDVSLRGRSDFDVHRLQHLFTEKGRRIFGKHTFARPPEITFDAFVVLPPWVERPRDWADAFQSSLRADGHVRVGQGSYEAVPYLSGSTDFRIAESVLHMPTLRIERPEGSVLLDYRSHMRTRDYRWHVDSTIDPKAVRPLLEDPEQQRVLDSLEFTEPPVIRGDIWGRWYARELTGFQLDLALANFIVRGGAFSNVTASVQFTNLVLEVTNLTVTNGAQWIVAEGVTVDIARERIFFTNVLSEFDPYHVTRVIGPKTAEAIEDYQFARPPAVRMEGSLPFNNDKQTDLHFDIRGGPFRWWKFNLPQVAGQAHWVTNTLVLTNVQGRAYEGNVAWDGWFDFSPPVGNNFRFHLDATNLNLHALMGDLHDSTNNLRGWITGTLAVTAANTEDWASWQGFGQVVMQEGHLWDIPMFGVFSPMLNAVVPGLGKSPVSSGTADFAITNSIIHTRNLELRAPTMRLQYQGTIDFDGHVNAEVEAELLRDAWLVGRVFSLAMAPFTKLFVYKVTGTLNEPKREPLYVPKLLLLPLQPLKTFKGLFQGDHPATEKPGREPPDGSP